MVRRLSVVLGLTLTLLGCSDEPSAEIAVAAPGDRVAWIGSSDALEVVLERVTPLYQEQQAGLREDQMLRERFGLDADEQLFRLHLFGDHSDLAQAGAVRLGAGELNVFADAPAELSVSDRLLWQSVLQGLPLDEEAELMRRSLIVHGRGLGEGVLELNDANWSNAEQSMVLRREVWNERSRRAFFDAALEVPGPPEVDPEDEAERLKSQPDPIDE